MPPEIDRPSTSLTAQRWAMNVEGKGAARLYGEAETFDFEVKLTASGVGCG